MGHVIEHLLSQGLDHIIIADHGSVDGTHEILERLSADSGRLHVVRDRSAAHYQSEKVSWLAHLAWRAGAEWIVPFDADEFWFAPETTVAEFLRAQPREVSLVHAAFHHMVPAEPYDDLRDARFLVDSVSAKPGKVAARSHLLLEIWPGNHHASAVGQQTAGLAIAHAQYRSPVQVARKLRQGAASTRATIHDVSWFSPHWEARSKLTDGEIDEVFANISSGRGDDRIQFRPNGDMISLRPLRWGTWDPDGHLAPSERR